MEKLETVVVLDHQWTASCRFADIVLPVTTRYERNDIEQFGTHSNKGLMAIRQIVKPQYEARHDFDVFTDLCKRFGRDEVYSEKRSEMEWIKAIYEEGVTQGAAIGVTMPDLTPSGMVKVISNIQRVSFGYATAIFAISPISTR